MSDTEIVTERDNQTGRFLPGNSGNGGRKPGSRNKLGEQFLADLRDAWNELGAEALARCAKEEPGQFCRIVASLLPKDLNINIGVVDPTEFASRFASAYELLGNAPPMLTVKPRVVGRKVASDRGR